MAQLAMDVDRSYTVRTTAGDQQVPVKGTSLNALLEAAQADQIGVKSVEISGGGRNVVLDLDQLSGAGAGSPVVYTDDGQAAFLRPAYSSGDLNGNDRLTAPSLTVRLVKRATLDVQGKVSDADVRVGQRLTFSATGRGGAGRELIYNWSFDDGSRRQSGAQVTHRFRQKGSYDVTVGLTTADDRVGTSDIVRVRVGPAAKGPDRAGGGTDHDADAPSSGTAAGGDSGVSGGTGEAASGPARAPERASPGRRSQAAQDPGGRTVEGTLLADATGALPREAGRRRAARTGNDREHEGGFRVPGVVWGVLITLGLAGTGALVELRSVLPRPGRTA